MGSVQRDSSLEQKLVPFLEPQSGFRLEAQGWRFGLPWAKSTKIPEP